MTARDHNKLLAIFYFILAGLQLVGGVVMGLIYIVMGGAFMASGGREDEQIVGGVFMGVGILIGLVMLVLGGFTLLTASTVLKERPVGRTLGIIVSILVLFSVPIGTALGIYGLWFFLGESGKNFYTGLSNLSFTPTAPPPSSWQ